MLIQRRAPYGSIHAQEGLEIALLSGAFAQQTSIAFIDDGVFQLQSQQNPAQIGVKQFTRAFAALGDFDINAIFVEQESLTARGLTATDLMPLTNPEGETQVKIVSAAALTALIARSDILINT